MLQQTGIDVTLVDKFQRTCLKIATTNQNELLASMINQKIENSGLSEAVCSLGDDFSDDFFQLEKILETSSIKPNTEDEPITCLSDFYKKKTFAKSLTSKSNLSKFPGFSEHITGVDIPRVAEDKPTTSKQTISPYNTFDANKSSARLINPSGESNKLPSKNWKFIIDDEDLSDDDCLLANDDDLSDDELKSTKKKRLSMSPLNKIEDTLFWIKHQSDKSNTNFENKEFSLTGKKKL